jgi:Ca-activated chloride channel family protein
MIQHISRIRNLAQNFRGCVLLLVVGLNASIASEALSADIHGTIRDKSGGVIAAARVSVQSAAGERRETVTNGSGRFAFARVVPGEYVVIAEHSDFRIQEQKIVITAAREEVRADFNLEIIESTESVDVSDMISLLCTVTDKRGQLITNLTAADFVVKEDGKTQTIARFVRETTLPLTVAVLIDSSLSVQPILPLEKQTAKEFLRTVLREQDLALAVNFDREVFLPPDFSMDFTELKKVVDSIQVGQGTSLHQAVHSVCMEKLLKLGGRKVIVLISDGDDTTSLIRFRDAVEATHRADVIVFAISNRLKSSAGEGDRTLKRYAADTGGRAFFPSTADELQMAFKAIERELRGQYSLSYDSSNSSLDGKFRRVKISLPRHQGLTVRAKKGYFAPAAGPDKVSRTSRPAPNPSLTRDQSAAGVPSERARPH